MTQYQPARGSYEISRDAAALLEQWDPARFPDCDHIRTIQLCNDALQERNGRTLRTLYRLLEGRRGVEAAALRREIQCFLRQKVLRGRPCAKVSRARTWDGGEAPRRVDQACFDRAAARGFPPDFFVGAHFDRVTVYCMPDGADCSGARFAHCRFSVCGVRGAVFDRAALHDTVFSSSLLHMVNFTGARLTRVSFHDCDLRSVSLQDARLTDCLLADCALDRVDFRGAALNGGGMGRLRAARIFNLQDAAISEDGATAEEVRQLRISIFRELGVLRFPERQP